AAADFSGEMGCGWNVVQPASATVPRMNSQRFTPCSVWFRCFIVQPVCLPSAAEADSERFAIDISLNVPAFIRLGEDVTADNSNRCTRDHIMRVMFSRLH